MQNTEPATPIIMRAAGSFSQGHSFYGFTILAFLKRMRHNVGRATRVIPETLAPRVRKAIKEKPEIQARKDQKGDKGDTGPKGDAGADGTGVTILGSYEAERLMWMGSRSQVL